MKTPSLTFSLLFTLGAASAAGCAAEVTSVDNDEEPDGTDPDQPVPTTPAGRYSMKSQLDLATNMPGKAGTVINYFIDATDDPDDPTKFIVDETIKAMPDGWMKNRAQDYAPYITGYLNDRLLQIAPDFLTKLRDTGDAFGQVAKKFGMLETLDVDAAGKATKIVNGVHFTVDSVPLDFLFADHAMQDVKVENLLVTLEKTGKLTISEHEVGFQYGALLRLALDQAIIPMIDPTANDLADLMKNAVNCQNVGQYIYEAVEFGSASTYESACNNGLTAASFVLYKELENVDGTALELGLTGVARGIDRNGDGTMDDIQTGLWSGSVDYAGTPAPLAEARFHGARM